MEIKVESYEVNPSKVLPLMKKYEAMNDEELREQAERLSMEYFGETLAEWKQSDPCIDLSREGLLDFIGGSLLLANGEPLEHNS